MVTERAFERSTGQAVSRTAYSRVCPSECQPAIAALVSIRLNPVPAGLVSGVFRARDGLGLRYALSVPHGSCRGTVVLMLGRADFIEKYFETIADLQGRGFAVATLDWRGQGGSVCIPMRPAIMATASATMRWIWRTSSSGSCDGTCQRPISALRIQWARPYCFTHLQENPPCSTGRC
jgi:hypothetical protein